VHQKQPVSVKKLQQMAIFSLNLMGDLDLTNGDTL
jgi:hypothetical protein